jgi:hypothetical protein
MLMFKARMVDDRFERMYETCGWWMEMQCVGRWMREEKEKRTYDTQQLCIKSHMAVYEDTDLAKLVPARMKG